MANSKYEYVRSFEREEILLPNTWIVVRIDGRGFHKLSAHYDFSKPNDPRALALMNAAATKTLSMIPSLILAYGVSDEYSFVFSRDTVLFERRRDKLVSTVVSTFTAAYVRLWGEFFSGSARAGEAEMGGRLAEQEGDDIGRDGSPAGRTDSRGEQDEQSRRQEIDLTMLPTFDARAITYPTTTNLRDYLSWRQVDCHINNLYNTTFWALVLRTPIPRPSPQVKPAIDDVTSTNENEDQHAPQTNPQPLSHTAAEALLKGTLSADKHELLFSRFGINYNNEKEIFRKGSVVYRHYPLSPQPSQHPLHQSPLQQQGSSISPSAITNGTILETKVLSRTQIDKRRKAKAKAEIVTEHCDIIKDEFWDRRPWLLGGAGGKGVVKDE